MTGGSPIVGDSGLPRAFIDFGLARLFGIPSIVWVALALAVAFGWLLHKTPFGIRVFSVGCNPQAAFLSGVKVHSVIIGCYAICGALAGVAGALLTTRLQSG